MLWFVNSVDKANGGCYPYHLHVSVGGCLIEGNSYYCCFLLLQVHFSCVGVMETTYHRVQSCFM